MKILVNASTLVVGGGVQVAVTFISHAVRKQREHEFIFLVSRRVRQNLANEISTEGTLLGSFRAPRVFVRGIHHGGICFCLGGIL